MNIVEIRNNIRDSFNLDELRDLCFELSIRYDDLPGDRLSDKSRELVLYCERREMINELLTHCQQVRPQIDWKNDQFQNETLNRSGYILSEVITMTFVDVIRLLSVTSSEMKFTYNIDRYELYWDIATEHMADFSKQLSRFLAILDGESTDNIERIERQFNWMLRNLKQKPNRPLMNELLFSKSILLSQDIHNFCIHTNHERYQNQWDNVKEEVSKILNDIKPKDVIYIDTLWKIRYHLQNVVLEKYQVSDKRLTSIGEDAVYDLSFLYFSIDYHLLPFSV